ncbi:MAG TPA: NAD(P)/FAD-dependent oxidoreductase, partial [Flavisolibacter sp.]|nr:NAD(P)/FAD-dependent oxidoreductase [Flavisolibacter sp.]
MKQEMGNTSTDILVVGGGAAGLAAAYELSLAGKKVVLLEAQERLGGRIHTIVDPRFPQPVEGGAEFIHGKLPATIRLLQKAGIKYHDAAGKMWRVTKGRLQKSGEFIEGWNEVMKRLKELTEDMTIEAFLQQYFGDEAHRELRESVLRYAEGYDAADASKASALSLRDEWENDDDEHQGRIDSGYAALVDFLAEEISKRRGNIHRSHIVKEIHWEKGKAEAITADNIRFTAAKLLLTIPLGVWQAAPESPAALTFFPALSRKKEAAQKMGYGTVIKYQFQFSEPFWEKDTPNKMKDAGFILSDAEVPTWWTQNPRNNGLLTGWLAGPKAGAWKEAQESVLLQKGLESLAYIFGISADQLSEKITAHQISNWANNPFACGAYSYATLDTGWAKQVLLEPVEHTLFFAGEALYEGT